MVYRKKHCQILVHSKADLAFFEGNLVQKGNPINQPLINQKPTVQIHSLKPRSTLHIPDDTEEIITSSETYLNIAM